MLFKETKFAFRLDGTHVVMQIDNVDVAMDHALAFKISASLNQMARRAKHLAGDISTHINVIATLTDANADAHLEQSLRDATAAYGDMTSGRKVN